MEETAYRGIDRQTETGDTLRSTTQPVPGRFSRRRSLASKITLIFLGGVIFSYSIGALVGWYMFVAAASEQWLNQARVNSQIASATLRSIYTYVSVTADTDGQVNGILTDKPIGDDASILVTGFNPSDVLALIGAQTKNAVWLFRYDEADYGFRQIAAAFDNATDDAEKPIATDPIFSRDAVAARFATGFATIGDSSHYIGLLPIISTETKKTDWRGRRQHRRFGRTLWRAAQAHLQFARRPDRCSDRHRRSRDADCQAFSETRSGAGAGDTQDRP